MDILKDLKEYGVFDLLEEEGKGWSCFNLCIYNKY